MKLPSGLKTAQLLNKTSQKTESTVKALLLLLFGTYLSPLEKL